MARTHFSLQGFPHPVIQQLLMDVLTLCTRCVVPAILGHIGKSGIKGTIADIITLERKSIALSLLVDISAGSKVVPSVLRGPL